MNREEKAAEPGAEQPTAGEETILAELAETGFQVRSLAALRESGRRYREAVPILLRRLPMAPAELKEEIIRALTVPWAKPLATQPMIEEFRRFDPSMSPTRPGLGWTIGNALEVLFDDHEFDELAELAQDRRYGTARQMIVLGFGKSKRPQAVELLLGLLDDPTVDGHAVKALANLKSPTARAALEHKLHDPRAWVRKEAKRGLAKISND